MFIKRSALHTLANIFSNGIPTENEERDLTLIHISELTNCALRLWLNLQEQVPSGFITMPMMIGTALHNMTQSIVCQMQSNVEVEVPISYLPEYPVIGQADIVDENYVIDLKFVSSWGYKNYMEKGNNAYKIQVLTYAYKLGKKFAAIFIVERGTLNFKAQMYIVDEHEPEILRFLDRARDIYESKEPPERDYSVPDKECNFCPYKERCW